MLRFALLYFLAATVEMSSFFLVIFHVNENYLKCLFIDINIDLYVPFGRSVDDITFWFSLCPHFCLQSKKKTMEHNLNVPYQVCVFRTNWKTMMATLASDWLLSNRFMEFNETWQEASSQLPLTSLCFGPIEKPRCQSWPQIGWEVFDFFSVSVTAEQNSMHLDKKQDLDVL